MTTVTPIDGLRLSKRAGLFEGRDEIPVSMFITEYDRGAGPDQHLHPYREAFVVQSGTARFTVDGEDIVGEAPATWACCGFICPLAGFESVDPF